MVGRVRGGGGLVSPSHVAGSWVRWWWGEMVLADPHLFVPIDPTIRGVVLGRGLNVMVEFCVLLPGEALCVGLVTSLGLVGDGRQLVPDWQRLVEQAEVVLGDDTEGDWQPYHVCQWRAVRAFHGWCRGEGVFCLGSCSIESAG